MKPAGLKEGLRRATAFLLCIVLCSLCPAAYSSDNSDREPAGKITGLTSSASQNGLTVQVRDVVRTNEQLVTNRSGRVRIQLDDGSILSMGSETQASVSKHDASTGETLIDLRAGRLRSRVVKVRKNGSKFQVVTPQARISVVGTDFFLDVSGGRTQVVVYSGIVLVGANAGGSAVDVAAGQTTTVDARGISRLVLTAEDYEQQTISETALPNEVPATVAQSAPSEPLEKPHSHLKRNLLIGAALAGGAVAAGLAVRGNSNSQTNSSPSQPSIPSIPPR